MHCIVASSPGLWCTGCCHHATIRYLRSHFCQFTTACSSWVNSSDKYPRPAGVHRTLLLCADHQWAHSHVDLPGSRGQIVLLYQRSFLSSCFWVLLRWWASFRSHISKCKLKQRCLLHGTWLRRASGLVRPCSHSSICRICAAHCLVHAIACSLHPHCNSSTTLIP
jgi:hypothetical protein